MLVYWWVELGPEVSGCRTLASWSWCFGLLVDGTRVQGLLWLVSTYWCMRLVLGLVLAHWQVELGPGSLAAWPEGPHC